MSQPWTDRLPAEVGAAIEPLIKALPLDQAMSQLVVDVPSDRDLKALAQQVVDDPALARKPELACAIWLYVDQLDWSHQISQGIDTPTGSYWHGIMHRREGDFSNSHYWFRRTGQHPAIEQVQQVQPEYDPHEMIDRAEQACRQDSQDRAILVQMQRDEWAQLFTWCASS